MMDLKAHIPTPEPPQSPEDPPPAPRPPPDQTPNPTRYDGGGASPTMRSGRTHSSYWAALT